jgi:hypothetical protein
MWLTLRFLYSTLLSDLNMSLVEVWTLKRTMKGDARESQACGSLSGIEEGTKTRHTCQSCWTHTTGPVIGPEAKSQDIWLRPMTHQRNGG